MRGGHGDEAILVANEDSSPVQRIVNIFPSRIESSPISSCYYSSWKRPISITRFISCTNWTRVKHSFVSSFRNTHSNIVTWKSMKVFTKFDSFCSQVSIQSTELTLLPACGRPESLEHYREILYANEYKPTSKMSSAQDVKCKLCSSNNATSSQSSSSRKTLSSSSSNQQHPNFL